MTTRRFISIGMILVLLAILSVAATWPPTQNASLTPTQQAACPGNSIVRVIPGENGRPGPALNIRKDSGGNIAGNTITGSLRYEDGDKRIVEEKDGYLRLEQGGWIWNRYLTIVCVTTPTPAISLTPSPTWCFACTPTPLVSRTPTPTPRVVIVTSTPPPLMLVFKYQGKTFFECRVPCEGLSIDLSR